jgi:hypothetical protein
MSEDPRDYDLDRVDTVADWLCRFVRDEVRPFLTRHREAARGAWERWLAGYEARKRRLSEWEERRATFLHHQAELLQTRSMQAAVCEEIHGPFPEDRVLTRARAVLSNHDTMIIECWMPEELIEYSGPPVELPFPAPLDRELCTDECMVSLLAVHDAGRRPEEWLGPANSSPFYILKVRVSEMTEEELPDLRAVLRAATQITDDANHQRETPQHDEPETPLPVFISASDLARFLGLPPARVESALRRFRSDHPDCAFEVDNPRRNEPRYLYRSADVRPVMERLTDD